MIFYAPLYAAVEELTPISCYPRQNQRAMQASYVHKWGDDHSHPFFISRIIALALEAYYKEHVQFILTSEFPDLVSYQRTFALSCHRC